MKSTPLCSLATVLLLVFTGCATTPAPRPVIRVAVIGGMTMTGLWQELTKQFEAESGWKVEVTATGPKPVLVEAFQRGDADLLTMHSSDAATTLVADGYGLGLRPWTRNELVIVGPPTDPAGIRGLTNGVEAVRRIAATRSPYVDFNDIGATEVAMRLWKKASLMPHGDWVLKDESARPQGVVTYAQQHQAYVIVGRIPVVHGKMPASGMEILVRGDPNMRRPYVVVTANPKQFPQANVIGAQALADYLTSSKGQQFLADFAAKQPDGVPLFYPITHHE